MRIIISLAAAALIPLLPQQTARYDEMFPTWSPDGRTIAFTSTRTGDPEIYTVGVDGTSLRRLTSVPGRDAHPSFSPDGRTIAFQSPREEGHTRIFVMNTDGSGQRALTANTGFCGVPVWSPDGRRLAFQCRPDSPRTGERDATWRIHVIDVATGDDTVRSNGPGNDQVPNWSPDGRELVFFSDRTGTDQLYLLDLETDTVRQITQPPHIYRGAAFSPAGTTIACIRYSGRAESGGASAAREGSPDDAAAGDIFLFARDGTNPRRVTAAGIEHGVPFFSPDGRTLVYQDETPAGTRIWMVDRDGGNERRLEGDRNDP